MVLEDMRVILYDSKNKTAFSFWFKLFFHVSRKETCSACVCVLVLVMSKFLYMDGPHDLLLKYDHVYTTYILITAVL